MHCRCGSALDLDPGDECMFCGHVMPTAGVAVSEEQVEYYYLSKADPGKWKRAMDEGHCLQMDRIGYKVKKVIRK